MSAKPLKRATNVSLDAGLVAEARRLEVNVSEACEAGLASRVAQARAQRWQEEHREAIRALNAYVDEHGLPLARSRLF